MGEDRFTDLSEHIEDSGLSNNLRPKNFDEYIGQEKLKAAMKLYIQAAKLRNEPMDHILLYGPPGLGKTSLAYVVANEMNRNIKITSGPVLEKSGDLASILTALEDGDVLFIDEIHRLNTSVEEILYPAMEDGEIDILIGKGHGAKSIRIDLPKFTLIGATTNAGKLSKPLRDRFGVSHRMEFYTIDELSSIIKRGAKILEIPYEDTAIEIMAKRSRGTPRLANRILKRARDYAMIKGKGIIDEASVMGILNMLEIDEYGLDSMDRRIINKIIENYNGGPVGLETLSLLLGEDKRTVEEVYEPYLVKNGLIKRTARGRVVTEKAYKHLGLKGE
ncbi:Holliday junction branch migration DNA helicase RuvB [Sneathia sanguinegens]|uniref:Holliday junction branch migration DNA helicase RuvB n=1 Tax=Sneathia sanguinegens TaxID=40543 RepID=UPI0023F94708|nr:Holliday junction branch migration DNA helicase RuvB [Sneathia sanguinegens]